MDQFPSFVDLRENVPVNFLEFICKYSRQTILLVFKVLFTRLIEENSKSDPSKQVSLSSPLDDERGAGTRVCLLEIAGDGSAVRGIAEKSAREIVGRRVDVGPAKRVDRQTGRSVQLGLLLSPSLARRSQLVRLGADPQILLQRAEPEYRHSGISLSSFHLSMPINALVQCLSRSMDYGYDLISTEEMFVPREEHFIGQLFVSMDTSQANLIIDPNVRSFGERLEREKMFCSGWRETI